MDQYVTQEENDLNVEFRRFSDLNKTLFVT
jgi:hypothetical protein